MKCKMICGVILATVLGLFPSLVAANTVELPISEVTVYPDRAQVSRFGHLELAPGEHSIIIENLPAKAADETFRVSVTETDGLTLLGFNHKQERRLMAVRSDVAALEEKIEEISKNDLAIQKGRLETFKEQKTLVIDLARSAGSKQTDDNQEATLDVSQWQTAFDFVGGSLGMINDSIRIVTNRIDEINRELEKLRSDLRSIQTGNNKTTKTVAIDLLCEQPCSFDMVLKYVVGDARWTPIYDARMQDDTTTVMRCYADITQKTGEDWTDARVIVSTAQPSHSLGPGDLMARYLTPISGTYGSSADERHWGGALNVAKMESNTGYIDNSDLEARLRESGDIPDSLATHGVPAQLGNASYAVTFTPPGQKTVKSGDQSKRILIADWNLESKVTYVCRPQNHQAVYRQARVMNQNEAPIIPGEVSVFVGTDFLGKTVFTDYIAPGEKFDLPCGVENNVTVERILIGKNLKHDNGIFSSDNTKREHTIKITLKNNDTVERMIQLEEALPVSQNDRIKVKLGSIEPEYLFQNEKGRAVWELALNPGQEQVVEIPIKIEHPDGLVISGL